MGGYLEIKLVKPTKVLSRTPDKAGVDQFLSAQAQADIRASDAGVLGEANAAVRQELGCLYTTNRVLHQLTKLMTLFVGDRGPQILDLNESFAERSSNWTPCCNIRSQVVPLEYSSGLSR